MDQDQPPQTQTPAPAPQPNAPAQPPQPIESPINQSPTQLPTQGTQPPGTSEPKNILLLMLGIIVLIVLAIGGMLIMRQSTNLQPKPTTVPTLATTAKPSPTLTKSSNLLPSFQETLNTQCKPVTKDGGTSYRIARSALPVIIDDTVVSINQQQENTFPCLFFSPENLNKNYVSVELTNNEKLNIYDTLSEELGHGGPPFLGSVGKLIKEADGEKYTIFLSGTDGPQLVGLISVAIRGEKRLTIGNGAPIFINYQTTAIQSDDPRLVTLLKDYSELSDVQPGARQVTKPGADDAIVKMFFANLANMGSGEKAALETVEKTLDAVTVK